MSNSKSKIFYKMYARGNYDKICNILFNQDLIFIKDIPISKSDDEEYLVSVAKASKLYEQDSYNIFIIVKFIENIRTHKRTYEAYLMVFINEQNNYHFTESPEHELRVEVAVHFKTATLDDKIPFLEIFIIPYLGWFAYCAIFFVMFLLMYDMEDFFKNAAFLFTGMTAFLIISSIWPNIQYLRPVVMPRDNVFTAMVSHLYMTDTPTNLWPSIHVYNAIGTHIAVANSNRYGKGIKRFSLVFSILIVLSTMFIKQHSVIDVLGGILFAIVMNLVVYKSELIVNAYARHEAKLKTYRM